MDKTELCKQGKHPLIVITRTDVGYDCEEVVRWCPVCGAVVVDMDVDNRVYPGYYKKMKFPERGV